ncbi:hypothetical protein [Sporosarcina koreensis]|uniref:Uncharacterized protein n=1 Tax=Sporosarcina koreensis TaxID=334735 RepID=A0ABW0TVW5_9BACL
MKKKFMLLTFSLITLVLVSWISTTIVRSGNFKKRDHTSIGAEYFISRDALYFGYDLSWEGIGRPTLKQIDFIKKDGTPITPEDDFLIQPFIEISSDGNTIGVLDEKTVMNEGFINNLLPFEDFQVDGKFRLVLRVEFHGNSIENDISELEITYKKFGITQSKDISFDEGIFTDE